MNAAHAKLSASGSHRWMACPASVSMESGRPETFNEAAAEGTAAHELAESCLRTNASPFELIGTEIEVDRYTFTVDDEMAAAVQVYLDYVISLPGERFIEQRVDFSHVVPGGFGTADAIVYDHESHVLHVVDLKFGKGVKVFATDNSQGSLYAIGALNDFGWLGPIKTVAVTIVQPRLEHVDLWETTPEALESFAADARRAADDALSDSPTFNPGERQCRFCKASGDCTALARHALETARQDFADLADEPELPDPQTLTDEQLGQVLERAPLFQQWLSSVEGLCYQRIEDGGEVPGWKLVAGRSVRQWGNSDEVAPILERELGPKAYADPKLISPTQAEKLLGKTHVILTDHVVKPEGKPVLAPASDKRPELPRSAVRDFIETE